MNKSKIPHSRPFFDTDDEKALLSVLRDKYVSTGRRSAKLGELAAGLLGKKWGIPTQSGTDALAASLHVIGIREGSRVAVPAYMCSAVLDALSLFRAVPVPVDIERETLAVSPELVNSMKSLDAAVGAHLFGIPAPLNRISNTNLVEDCAQTLGIRNSDGVMAGAAGRISICSFYATKLLTSGHGGLIAGDSSALRRKVLDLLDHDNREKWIPRMHFHMSDLNAALGISQMKKIEGMIARRRMIAERFTAALTGSRKTARSVFSRFLVAVADGRADRVISEFNRSGIEAKRPVFRPTYKYLGLDDRDFPNSKWAHGHIVSVPLYPGMDEDEISQIEEFLGRKADELRCWPPV